jgi:hypothetical protein
MANTTNYNWATPDDTDLVKDGAAAIRTLGSSIDTSLVDLLGGTTGQVLSKTSGTDMDFTWVDTDDANAIQNAIVDAKGDLVAASGADTPARLAVGNNGETLVADSSTSTGLAYREDYAAGKNKIINGDFRINQRAFTSNTGSAAYNFDRWRQINAGGSWTLTPQTFTPGAAPVAGYEGSTFLQGITASQSADSDQARFNQRIESVRTLAGATATISFWAKAGSGTPQIGIELGQNFGAGGSSFVSIPVAAVTISTSWARYSATIAVPSISGKTIGTDNSDNLDLYLWVSAGSDNATRASSIGIQNNTFQIWGVQVEQGSVATAFQTATGTLAGELAACQRYYVKFGLGLYSIYGIGFAASTTRTDHLFVFPVEMRVAPTLGRVGTINPYDGNGFLTTSGISLTDTTTKNTNVRATVTGATQFRPYALQNNNDATGYLEFSGEL